MLITDPLDDQLRACATAKIILQSEWHSKIGTIMDATHSPGGHVTAGPKGKGFRLVHLMDRAQVGGEGFPAYGHKTQRAGEFNHWDWNLG